MYTVSEDVVIGIRGAYVESKKALGETFFLPASGEISNQDVVSDRFEFFSFFASKLYMVDHENTSFSILAEHHYYAGVLENKIEFGYLMNKEVCSSDGIVNRSWNIATSDWLDFEQKGFIHERKTMLEAIQCFAAIGVPHETIITYSPLVRA